MVNISYDEMIGLRQHIEDLEMIKSNIKFANPLFSANEKKIFEDKITTAITLLNYIIENYRYMPHEKYMIIMKLVGDFTSEVTEALKAQRR